MTQTVKEAAELDAKNGDTKWIDSISKEMANVRVAFDILKDGDRVSIGHKQINCHLIYDVKIEEFRRKDQLVAGGHMTETPKCMTYSSVVGQETLRIALTIAALNNLQVKAGDVMNAYVTAPSSENIWTVLGKEFGSDQGNKDIIVRALYGLKSCGEAFHSHLTYCMRSIGYTLCRSYNDLWMKPQIEPDIDK